MTSFRTDIKQINGLRIVMIPQDISQSLPSRGMVACKAEINGINAFVMLEPDGHGSHWFELPRELPLEEMAEVALEPIKEWPLPNIPSDLALALNKSELNAVWNSITNSAKWDWIRWINFTSNDDTRKRRIDIACSKLSKGDKRPCCFDRTRCTVTRVSKSGKLIID